MDKAAHLTKKTVLPWWLGFSAALLLLTALAGWALVESQRAAAARERATHTLLVLKEALALENAVTLMESRQRGFLVDGDRLLLQRRDADHARAAALVAELRAMVRDNPEQGARLDAAERMIAARYAAMRASAELADRSGLEAARAGLGRGTHDAFLSIKTVLDGFVAEEERLLALRSRNEASDARRFNRALVAGTAVTLVLLLLSMGALAAQLRRANALRTELADAHALQRAILDAAGYMVIAVDPRGRITTFNRTASEVLGYTPEEVIGRHDLGLFHVQEELAERAKVLSAELGEEVEPGFEACVAKARHGTLDVGQWTYVRRDGSRFPVQLAVSAMRDGEGRVLGFVGMAEDISQRLANERELRQTNRELESFSYTISHDLRAPLRHIDGYARMLQEDAADALDGDSRRYLDEIGAAARRMGTLIDDLLAFSRLGRKPVERIEVDVNALLERVLEEAGADGRVEVEPLPPVQADPVLLKQVWVNLVSNALKYSAPRGNDARIQITGERDGAVLRYRIRDNGVGFDMRYADKLYGVFQRLHSEEEFEGTGVGLAIVQRILSRHGGTIAAESQVGQGATFSFDLPRVDHDQDPFRDREMCNEA